MAERSSDRWISFAQSVVLHGTLVALLVYGFWAVKHREPPPVAQNLGIEAVALDSKAAAPAKAPQPPPPEPKPPPPAEEPAGPPTPTPEEIAQREQEKRDAEEKRKVQEQRVAEEKEKRAAQEEHEAAERQKQEQAEAKRVAEQKRLAELQRKEDEKKKADEARLRYQREQELRHSLEEEERVMAARSSGALASWQAQISARIQRAWLRPSSAKPGIDCVVNVSQIPGGEVTDVRVGACNGDQAVRESIESAVYRASPLPPPPDPSLFERNLEIHFKPTD